LFKCVKFVLATKNTNIKEKKPELTNTAEKLKSGDIIISCRNTVAYLLKARTVEPEKQPLLANGSETTFFSRQRSRNRQRNDVRC
jgi:hypothetical protein